MKRIVSLILAMLMVFSLVACGGEKTPDPQPEPTPDQNELNIDVTDIVFQSGSTGGNWAIVQPAIVQTLEDAMPDVTVTGITGKGAANLRAIQAKECDMAFTQGYAYEDAIHGINDFEADGAMDNVCVIMSTNVSYMYFVATKASGVKTIEDIRNANLNCNAAGGGVEIANRRILEAYGITYDDITNGGHTLNYQGMGDVVALMQDGHVDVTLMSALLDNATTHQMESTFDIEILSFDGDGIKNFCKEYPSFFEAKMPAGIYKGQDTEKNVVGWTGLMVCRRDLSDDVVYLITKTLYENAQKYGDVVDEYYWMGTEGCLTGFDLNNLHPGAARYYKEIGLL